MDIKTSHRLFEAAQRYFPGGVNSPVRAWRSVGGEPLFVERGDGQFVTDADGNTFLDYVGSWGPLILGHAFPDVVRAIQHYAALGTSYGAPTELEIELAKRITSSIPSMEMMRFVNSGTEATMSAIRVARAFTGRTRIVKFDGGYHGHADFLLTKAGSGVATLGMADSAGVPIEIASTTLIAPYNNLAQVERILDAHDGTVAAVVVEPVAGNMGVVPPLPGFLDGLRKLTQSRGILLLFDEVITGFRISNGGAQSLYGVTPDLTCLGKIVGGGLPVGVYGGRRAIMEMISPLGPVYQAGTLSGNPLAMAAGIATLESIHAQDRPYERLEEMGRELQEGLNAAASSNSIPVRINRVGSMFTVFFTESDVQDYPSAKCSDTQRYARFFHGMLDEGIYLPPSQFEANFVSLAHTERDIDETVQSAGRVFKRLGSE